MHSNQNKCKCGGICDYRYGAIWACRECGKEQAIVPGGVRSDYHAVTAHGKPSLFHRRVKQVEGNIAIESNSWD
jgi:hypothetical protein